MFRNFCAYVVKRYNNVKDMIQEGKCKLSESELEEYQSFTFLSKSQIKRIYWLFHSLDPERTNGEKDSNAPQDLILNMPLLWLNPFKDRIVKVFSSDEEVMHFEEFLEMMSVFSDKADPQVKAEYAFRIYDFGEDGLLDDDDLRELLHRLEGRNRFTAIDIEEIVENIMAEGDIDADGFITFPEFKHLVQKCPDFVHSFRIRI